MQINNSISNTHLAACKFILLYSLFMVLKFQVVPIAEFHPNA